VSRRRSLRLRVFSLLLPLAVVLALPACGSDDDEAEATVDTVTTVVESSGTNGECQDVDAPEPRADGGEQPPNEVLDPAETYRLVVDTNCGSFTIELDQKAAPKTAASLVSLAKSGFFDGTTFHRVVPGFVIQGGDPTGTGTGGPGYKTVDVPPSDAAYTKGVVAMAKGEAEAAGMSGSQFFVVTGADAGLPPEYAVVGKVTEGIETVDAIDALGAGDGPPSKPVVIEHMTVQES
jgi:peptidyl-prolyl cis-trans isomerase B (cyclophilin B)